MQRLAPPAQHVGEVDQQNPVRHHDAHHHDDAHEAVHAQLGAGQVQHDEHARHAEGHAEHDDQRIDERLELAGQHHVHQGQRHEGGEDQAAEGLLLFQGLATQGGGKPSGGGVLSTTRWTASLAAPRSAVGATLAVTCTMRCKYLRSIMTGPLLRSMRARLSTRHDPAAGRAHEHVAQVRHVPAVGIRHAHVDVVLVAGLGIGERHRGDLRVAKQADQDGLRHVLLGNAQHARLLAVHHHVQFRAVLLARRLDIRQQRPALARPSGRASWSSGLFHSREPSSRS